MLYPGLGRSKRTGRVIDFRWYRVGERCFAFAAGPPSWGSFRRWLRWAWTARGLGMGG